MNLPTDTELNEIWQIVKSDASKYGFQPKSYWSSTEFGNGVAVFRRDFINGIRGINNKHDWGLYARCVK